MSIGRIGSTDRVGRDQGSAQTDRTESARDEMLGGIQNQNKPEVKNKKVDEVAKMYEEQFLREMVKAMRSTVSEGGLTKSSMGEKIYREQMDNQYVESWSAQGGVGFADLIYKQIMEQYFQKPQVAKQFQNMPAVGGGKANPNGVTGIPRVSDRELQAKPLQELPSKDSQHAPVNRDDTDIKTGNKPVLEKDVSLLLKLAPAKSGQASAPKLLSPWDAIISQKQTLADGQVSLRLKHPGGLDSTFLYQGVASPLDVGQEVKANQELAVLSPDTQSLIWNLRSTPI